MVEKEWSRGTSFAKSNSKVKKYGFVVLLSVTSFLNDKHMLEDFFHLLQNDEKKSSHTEIMVTPGVVIETPRAAGSGMPRIIYSNL